MSGGGGAKNVEEKVVAVFDRQFALALQQVDVKDQDQLLLGFFLICVSLQKEEELATIDERILEVRRSISRDFFQICMKKSFACESQICQKNIELVYSLTSISVIAVLFRLMEVVRRGSVNNYYAPTQTPQVQNRPHNFLYTQLSWTSECNSAWCLVPSCNQEGVCGQETQGGA